MKLLLLGMAMIFPLDMAFAEPWMAARFAQNCSSCHTQGRKDLPLDKKKCTMSCQSCHANPNGGGLRNHYGKWTEERWLRSFRSDQLAHTKSVVPAKGQLFTKRPFKRTKDKKPTRGYPLQEMARLPKDERAYGPSTDKNAGEIATSIKEFEYYIPENDPYRLTRSTKVDAGMDFRWQFNEQTSKLTTEGAEDQSTSIKHSFPMVADFYLGYRPVHQGFKLVYENRVVKSPVVERKTENFLDLATRRSLYAVVDDLPYNSYVMGGFYRPRFGYYTADHSLLAQKMQAYALTGTLGSYNLQYEAATIGGAMNMPYANVHVITRQLGPIFDKKISGFAANLGAYFSQFSSSIHYSYWITSRDVQIEDQSENEKVEMHSIYASASYGDLIVNLDLTSFARDNPHEDFRQGGVYTLDTYYKAWRENYLNLQFSKANTSLDLRPGSGQQIRFGVKSYIVNGMQLLVHYEIDENTLDLKDVAEVKTTKTGILTQIHLFL